jgi:hypothetical protein
MLLSLKIFILLNCGLYSDNLPSTLNVLHKLFKETVKILNESLNVKDNDL